MNINSVFLIAIVMILIARNIMKQKLYFTRKKYTVYGDLFQSKKIKQIFLSYFFPFIKLWFVMGSFSQVCHELLCSAFIVVFYCNVKFDIMYMY